MFSSVINCFERALQKGKLPHAWLFIAPCDSGKRQLCFDLAALLLDRPHLIPSAAHPEFLTLSAPTIEAFLSFKNRLRQKTLEGHWRVAYLSGVHLLNTYILNALLKILEEPPPLTLFLLTAEEPVLPTIASRCLTQILPPLPPEEFAQHINHSDSLLYKLSYGYTYRAEVLKKSGTLEAADLFLKTLESALEKSIILPTSFFYAMIPHKAVWEEWLTLWFHQKLMTASEEIFALQIQQTFEKIRKWCKDALIYHIEARFVLQGIFAIVSLEMGQGEGYV
jgi:hypothetical protein